MQGTRASMAARRCASTARHPSGASRRRLISSGAVLREEASSHVGVAPTPRKPVGGIRGGVIGFLFGFSLASSFAAYRLLDEYKQASAVLQASVEELQRSTETVSAHVRRIEAVEKDLKALSNSSASKDDLSRIRAEVKKIYDGLHIGNCLLRCLSRRLTGFSLSEFLDLRTFVWGMQQDVHALAKSETKDAKPPMERI
ncbi:hypothetical protein BC834DRAFT_904144 [Gloeopeniophorella convolvens]|nr:hypothetical protein BC834DRAFT_904144 [Gloeopeniophorella convolvens]